MKERFIPITMERAERLDRDAATENKEPLPEFIWANSKAEAELMENMSDEELARYLKERDGGKEQ